MKIKRKTKEIKEENKKEIVEKKWSNLKKENGRKKRHYKIKKNPKRWNKMKTKKTI